MSRRNRAVKRISKKLYDAQISLVMRGCGELAYVRRISPQEARCKYAIGDALPSVMHELYAADGECIALVGSYEEAIRQARDQDLAVVSLH